MAISQELDSGIEIQCPECDYNLKGVAGERCPSCGWEIDYQVLLAQARAEPTAKRYAVALTALAVGAGSLVALASLAVRGNRLNLFDGFIVLSVALAAVGHLGLAVLSLPRHTRWPMHTGPAADLIRFAAVLSLALGIVGAAQFLTSLPANLVVRGVQVSGVLEFTVAALLLFLPGSMLLILRLVSFAHSPGRSTPPKEHARSSLPVRASFCVDFIRLYPESAVATRWSDEPGPTTPALEEIINRTWEAQTQRAAAQDRLLYDGRLVRLAQVSAGRDSLLLDVGPTTFRRFVGTNLYNAQVIVSTHPDGLANALGVSAVVVCADHVLAFGRRGDGVLFHAGCLHTFGGLVEQSDVRPDGRCDAFGALRRELLEEAAIRPDEIREMSILGQVRDGDLLQPELVFQATLRIPSTELQARFDPAAAGQEHSELVFLFEDPDAVLPFLRRMSPVAPVAEAALLLHGRLAWGGDWYEQTCYILYGEVPPSCGASAGRPP